MCARAQIILKVTRFGRSDTGKQSRGAPHPHPGPCRFSFTCRKLTLAMRFYSFTCRNPELRRPLSAGLWQARNLVQKGNPLPASRQGQRILAMPRHLRVGIARAVPVRFHGRFCHEKRMRNCSTGKGIFLQAKV